LTDLSSGERGDDDGGELDIVVLLLLVLLLVLVRDVSLSLGESLRGDDLVRELDDRSAGSVSEVLSESSVGEREVSGNSEGVLDSL
jgi:hypothetical protein